MNNSNGNTWKFLIQGTVTVGLAALAAYGGMRVGLAEMKANQMSMQYRLDRIESKLDRLSERYYYSPPSRRSSGE